MANYRMPGQPYTVHIDEVEFTCKPMKRVDSMALASKSAEITDGTDMEDIYNVLVSQIESIDIYDCVDEHHITGETDIRYHMDFQTHDFMLTLFKEIIGASGMTDEESKNSKPSSAGPQPAGIVEPSAESENASF